MPGVSSCVKTSSEKVQHLYLAPKIQPTSGWNERRGVVRRPGKEETHEGPRSRFKRKVSSHSMSGNDKVAEPTGYRDQMGSILRWETDRRKRGEREFPAGFTLKKDVEG